MEFKSCDDCILSDKEIRYCVDLGCIHVSNEGAKDLFEQKTKENDVTRPNHYKQKDGKETWDEWTDIFGVNGAIISCLSNVVKYIARAGKKDQNSYEQDMNKAKMYYKKALKLSKQYNKEVTIRVIDDMHTVGIMLMDKELNHGKDE